MSEQFEVIIICPWDNVERQYSARRWDSGMVRYTRETVNPDGSPLTRTIERTYYYAARRELKEVRI